MFYFIPMSFYFMAWLFVFATDPPPASLQLFLIRAAVSERPSLQGVLAERGAYVRELGKMAETFFVYLMFY